jgi:NhaP-type Na+/H+ or K+/H+ antiporter
VDGEQILIGLAGIFVLGIGAQWIAWRIRLPSILLLLPLGFIAGQTGWLDPEKMFGDLLFPLLSLSVALILFEGALGLQVAELHDVGKALRNLLSIGVLITWAICTLAAWLILDFPLPMALLLGSMLIVTGPTVVGPMLRHIRPTGKVSSIARWEGIVIDPIGAVLAVLVFEAIKPLGAAHFGEALQSGIEGLLITAVVGGVFGYVAAKLLTVCLQHHWIPERLQSAVTLMTVVAVFVASNAIQHEAGLLTVTVLGIVMANQTAVCVKPIVEFKENLAVLLISSLFIMLSARVDLDQITALGWRGPVFVAAVILIGRPLSVWLSTLRSDLSREEKIFLAWMAPRGIVAAAVASVFALRLSEGDSGLDGSGLVPATFLVILGTVVVYGFTTFPLSRALGLSSTNPQGVLIASAHAGARAIAHALQTSGMRVVLVDTNRSNIKTAQMEGLEACYANILSEQAMDEIDLGGIGRFMALTSNNEVNSLSAMHFSELFGRQKVYQLPPVKSGSERTAMAAHHLHGRFLFSTETTYEALDNRFEHGSTIKTTRLSAEFTFESLSEHYGETAVPLFIVTETDKLVVITEEKTVTPKSGEKVIALVDVKTKPPND